MPRHLYSITLQKPTSITQSVIGNFSGEKQQEIVAIRGSCLELLKLDADSGQLNIVLSQNFFAILRCIQPFRTTHEKKDRLIVTSDSGKISILEYQPDRNKFICLHAEPYGKTGVRRVVPGQYLAVDPKGRACIIASVEKNKFVYVLNRDQESNVTISSPLEAHTQKTLVYEITAMDVGLENPAFASLEVDYSNQQESFKKVVFYELDLGLNNVMRKWTQKVDQDANYVIPVFKGKNEGPGGVLVCTKNWVYYLNQKLEMHKVPIPRRRRRLTGKSSNAAQDDLVITSSSSLKVRSDFFILLQANNGDLFKLTLDWQRDTSTLISMDIKFFQTIPLCNSMNILKSGYLFAAYESGNHQVYQFASLGDDIDTPTFKSISYMKSNNKEVIFDQFETENLEPHGTLNSLDSLMGVDVASNNMSSDDTPQLHTISGQKNQSTFRTLKYGLPSNFLTSTPLPSKPLAVWTIKKHVDDEFDSYVVLAFAQSTIVLKIGDQVSQTDETGINRNVQTLAIKQIGKDAILQVHPKGVRHIVTNEDEITEWKPELSNNERIIHATCNGYQLAIALNTSQLVYFEVDDEGHLNEYQERVDVPGGGVSCLSIGDLPPGKVRSSFLAIGCGDATIRILSLDLGSTLEPLTVQALTSNASDILISHMKSSEDTAAVQYLHIGLSNGVYISSVLDSISGQLSDTRTRFLGPQKIRLFAVKIGMAPVIVDAVLALSTKSWLGYATATTSFDMAPVDVPHLKNATSLKSSQVHSGIIGIEPTTDGSNLHIFTINNLSDKLRQSEIQLTATPRRFTNLGKYYYIIESDCLKNSGKWKSFIEVVDPLQNSIMSRIDLGSDEDDDNNNDAAFSISSCYFGAADTEYIIVGGSTNQIMLPRKCKKGWIKVYKIAGDWGERLELMHTTDVDQAPLAFCQFEGRLLAGIGNKVRIYDIGSKQLLRKNEIKLPISGIATINVDNDKIVVADVRDSVTWLVYKYTDDTLIPFADDTISRHVTCSVMVDSETSIHGDRFGNLFMMKNNYLYLADEDDHGVMLRNERPTLNGSSAHRLDLESHFYINDTPTSLCKASLVNGGTEAVIYSGIQGTIGALIPLTSKSDTIFFQTLENLIRKEESEMILERNHMKFRGYYAPGKATIDGDLCERFSSLPKDRQTLIAQQLGDRTIREVERKIADMRIRSVF